MRRKKGILLPEGIKLIIALLCIGLLFYLMFSMVGLFTKKSKIEQGRTTLDEIFAKAASLKDGESGKVLVLAPSEWYIISFREGEMRPEQCKAVSCVCICEDDDAESCNEAGICKNTVESVSLVKAVQIEKSKAFNMKVTRTGNTITLEAEIS